MIVNFLKSQSTIAQLFRYTFVAGVGLVFDFGTVIFTKQVLGFHYLIAAVTGFLVGLVITYIFSNLLVFGKPQGHQGKVFMLFALIGVIGLGLLTSLMWIMTGLFGLNYIASKALATIVVFMWNFFARKSLYKEARSIPYEL